MANWDLHAARLAAAVTHPTSRWRDPVARVPRHVFVPRWFDRADHRVDTWVLHHPEVEEQARLEAAYADRSLVTSVEGRHADHVQGDERVVGRPTSSSTLPTLVVIMLRYGYLQDSESVLDVGTGSGYATALLARRLGESHVTSVDIDPYLTKIAAERLDSVGLHPQLITCDATGPLPGQYDRLIATTSVRSIPSSWLQALRPGGRLVTAITNTSLLITADKTPDGGAVGQVEWIGASFMPSRTTGRCASVAPTGPWLQEDGELSQGRYPIPNIGATWDLRSMLELAAPGIDHAYEEREGHLRIAWLSHPDGSWAEATATQDERPQVRQAGPRRLWDTLDAIRERWLTDCEFPLRGAKVAIAPDGSCQLTRGRWQATIA